MARDRYLFRQMVWLAMAVALPLLVLLGYNLWLAALRARGLAHRTVQGYAAAMARDTDGLLASADQYLRDLSRRPLIAALDRAAGQRWHAGEQACDEGTARQACAPGAGVKALCLGAGQTDRHLGDRPVRCRGFASDTDEPEFALDGTSDHCRCADSIGTCTRHQRGPHAAHVDRDEVVGRMTHEQDDQCVAR